MYEWNYFSPKRGLIASSCEIAKISLSKIRKKTSKIGVCCKKRSIHVRIFRVGCRHATSRQSTDEIENREKPKLKLIRLKLKRFTTFVCFTQLVQKSAGRSVWRSKLVSSFPTWPHWRQNIAEILDIRRSCTQQRQLTWTKPTKFSCVRRRRCRKATVTNTTPPRYRLTISSW